MCPFRVKVRMLSFSLVWYLDHLSFGGYSSFLDIHFLQSQHFNFLSTEQSQLWGLLKLQHCRVYAQVCILWRNHNISINLAVRPFGSLILNSQTKAWLSVCTLNLLHVPARYCLKYSTNILQSISTLIILCRWRKNLFLPCS